jgi:hypothetical protein
MGKSNSSSFAKLDACGSEIVRSISNQLGRHSFCVLIAGGVMENMMMPSCPIWLIGGALIILFSVLLRYLADEAHEVASSSRRASLPADPKSTSALKDAA